MRRVTLKGLLAKKNRLVLTVLAVVMGVAFLSAGSVLTATIQAGARDMFGDNAGNAAVEVRGAPAFASDSSLDPTREPLPESVIATIRAIDGVAAAAGSVQGYAEIEDPDGNRVADLATKTIGSSADGIGTVSPFELRSGRVPGSDNEIAVDAATARDQDLAIGDLVTVRFTGPAATFTIVGTVGFGDLDGVTGTAFTLFDMPTAQRLFDRVEQVDDVYVAAVDGVTPTELARRIDTALAGTADVATSDDRADERAEQTAQSLSIVDKGATVFAYIALVVGGFIIVNTFTIVVAQRTRELALLRALGASRRQVRRSVLTEAAITGFIASAIGTALGIGVAAGLRALVEATGVELPGSGVVVETSSIAMPLIVGVMLTVLAAYLPARRAAKLAPLAAMRDVEQARPRRRRYVVGGLLTAAGAVLGLTGVPLMLIGVALLSPLVVPPLAGVVGRFGARFRKVPGRLGYQNAARNPRRTASTASALMIGLALVVGLTVAADSALSQFGDALDDGVTADFIVDSELQPLGPELAQELADVPEVGVVSAMRAGEFQLEGETAVELLSAMDGATIGKVADLGFSQGSLERLQDGGVLVSETRAEDEGWKVGDVLPMRFARTGVQQITIDGTYAEDALEPQGFLLSMRDFEANYTDQLDIRVLVSAADGVSPADAEAAVDEVAGAFANARVLTNDEYKADAKARLDIVLAIVAVVLGLAIVIAVLGIINTLALSIVERTRELGLLRAVGMTRRQVRSMVRWEAVTISVIGGVLGVAVGMQIGVTLSGLLSVDEVTYPWSRLAMLLGFAVIVGVAAAALPARRAARLDVLAAVGHE